MLNALKLAGVVLISFMVGTMIMAVFQPTEFNISRAIFIKAPVDKVFPMVNDFHNWPRWSPWAKLDPNMHLEHRGAGAGQGAIYWWSGNEKVGEGQSTILVSQPNRLIEIKFEFMRPFKSTNLSQFIFYSHKNETSVTWIMTGKRTYPEKVFTMFVKLDKAIAKDFDRGLVALKAEVEGVAPVKK